MSVSIDFCFKQWKVIQLNVAGTTNLGDAKCTLGEGYCNISGSCSACVVKTNMQSLTLADLTELKDTTVSDAIILPGTCFHIMFNLDGLNISSERKV